MWLYDSGALAWNNSSSFNSLLTSTPNFPIMAVGDKLVIEGAFQWLNNSGANQGLAFQVKDGTGAVLVNVATPTTIASSASPHLVGYRVVIVCKTVGNAANGVVFVTGVVGVTIATANNPLDAELATTSSFVGGGSLNANTNGSGAPVLDVRAKMTTASASATITPGVCTAEYWTKIN